MDNSIANLADLEDLADMVEVLSKSIAASLLALQSNECLLEAVADVFIRDGALEVTTSSLSGVHRQQFGLLDEAHALIPVVFSQKVNVETGLELAVKNISLVFSKTVGAIVLS